MHSACESLAVVYDLPVVINHRKLIIAEGAAHAYTMATKTPHLPYPERTIQVPHAMPCSAMVETKAPALPVL